MNDRELLELAARAAGYQFSYSYRSLSSPAVPVILAETGRWRQWDPRHDDGDALRLAVSTRLHKRLHEILTGPAYRADALSYGEQSATRRAITKAAADIGKSMGGGE
ncbi:TPA: hypothetical protein VDU70_002233 [Pseudomonas aeruginosa]|nr:hypothetical protein [Pseudomonas aeruginosa]HEP8852282.1 hypothetical protein [Pseudomonas aeruginosa]